MTPYLINPPISVLLTGMEAKKTMRSKKLVNRAKKGEFNLLWLIVTVVAVVIAVIILYYVFAGGMRTLGATNTPAIQASEANGIITINIKATGTGDLSIYGITLYSGTSKASCSSVSYYVDGQSYTPPSSGPLVILKPGQTFTLIESSCTPTASHITAVQTTTKNGTLKGPIS